MSAKTKGNIGNIESVEREAGSKLGAARILSIKKMKCLSVSWLQKIAKMAGRKRRRRAATRSGGGSTKKP